jgi:hypothetical protein
MAERVVHVLVQRCFYAGEQRRLRCRAEIVGMFEARARIEARRTYRREGAHPGPRVVNISDGPPVRTMIAVPSLPAA